MRSLPLAVIHTSEKKEPGNQVATTRVLYFFQRASAEIKPFLHWPPVTFISTSLRDCKKDGSLSTICSGSQLYFLQQALDPIPHSEDVCQSTRKKKENEI